MASIRQWTFVLCCVIFMGQPVYTQCISTGARNAGTSASVAYPGSNFSFSNLVGASLSDDSKAASFTLLSLLSGQTQFLQATNFGFSIPATAVICGITAEVEKSASGIGLFTSITDRDVYIIKNGARTGVDKASGAAWTGTDAYASYGGATDNWGTSWMPSDINAGNFGIAIAANIHGLIGLVPVARIDHVRITIHYYEPTLLWSAITDFSLHVNHGKVQLQWMTGESTRFLVQRSADNIHWQTIAELTNQYHLEDAHPLPGQSYYRLMAVEAWGGQTHSFSKSLLLPAEPSLQCYPNPFADVLYISGAGGQQVWLRDLYGRVIALPKGNKFELGDLPAGTYFISVGKITKKLVKN